MEAIPGNTVGIQQPKFVLSYPMCCPNLNLFSGTHFNFFFAYNQSDLHIYNLLAVTLPKDEIELQPFENEHDCDDENPVMKESVTTKTSIWLRHRCLIISVIFFLVISSIAATLAVVLVPRTSGMS